MKFIKNKTLIDQYSSSTIAILGLKSIYNFEYDLEIMDIWMDSIINNKIAVDKLIIYSKSDDQYADTISLGKR